MAEFTEQVLSDAVQGDLDAFSLLLEQQGAPRARPVGIASLTLTPEAVRTVLLELRNGQFLPVLIQQWASFVRRGYIAGSMGQRIRLNKPTQPIEIDYDPHYEGCIVEVISRLDEIGDLIDGSITDSEISAMLSKLSKPLTVP